MAAAIGGSQGSEIRESQAEQMIRLGFPDLESSSVKNMLVQSCIAPKGIETFLQLSGAQNEHISLIGNDLSGAKNVLNKEDKIEVYMDSNRLK